MSISNPEPTVIAPFVNSSISGDLNSSLWKDVPVNGIRHFWSGDPAPASRHAEAQVCWTEDALNVRFVCRQEEPLVVAANPVRNQKTLRLWERDVCEVFIAPDLLDPTRYFEFEAAPTGEWVDLGIVMTPDGRETDWDYKSGMSVVTDVDESSVTIGVQIPWSSSIPKPECETRWRVNLFRCVGPESESRYLAWQPTRTPEPSFHVPEAFGWLHFK